MKNVSPICYLCGQPQGGKFNHDHVPPKQLSTKKLRNKHNLNLFWLPTHESCNKSYQHDEDYFVYSLMPFARGSYSGDALRAKILDDCRHDQQKSLLQKGLREFERRPSGLILPPGVVVKRFDGDRIPRVAWKIVRGLIFHHYGIFLEEGTPTHCKIVPPDQPPPLPFPLLLLYDNPINRNYEGVFEYSFGSVPEKHNMNYCALLLWDRLTIIMNYQYPPCDCLQCHERFGTPHCDHKL